MDTHAARLAMVREQLVPRRINDSRVLQAMATVPRHAFVPIELLDQAYADRALPIDEEQTISQPYIVALMAQALRLHGPERVLEVGAGSGYSAAILAYLAQTVISLERHARLAAGASQRLRELHYTNIQIIHADGSIGWLAGAPYDAISVPAGAPDVPQALLEQLAKDGRLVIPVGEGHNQRLLRITRGRFGTHTSDLGPVRFVPLIGQAGWEESV